MRFNVFFLMAACLLSLSAEAKNGYFGARVLVSDVHETEIAGRYKTAAGGSAYVGAYTSIFRVEGEYTVLGKVRHDSLGTSSRLQRVMANGYIDMYFTRFVRPYLGAGVGSTFYSVEHKSSGAKESGNNFTWNATAGVGVRLTHNVTIDTGYRFVNMGDVELENKSMHFDAHEFYTGLRFLF